MVHLALLYSVDSQPEPVNYSPGHYSVSVKLQPSLPMKSSVQKAERADEPLVVEKKRIPETKTIPDRKVVATKKEQAVQLKTPRVEENKNKVKKGEKAQEKMAYSRAESLESGLDNVDKKESQPSLLQTMSSGIEAQPLINESDSSQEVSDPFQEWVAQLQYRINRFKAYPYQAKRRRLQGEVQVEATINADGTLQSAKVLSGKKIFQTNSLKAVHRSLPLPPPGKQAITVVFSIHYKLI